MSHAGKQPILATINSASGMLEDELSDARAATLLIERILGLLARMGHGTVNGVGTPDQWCHGVVSRLEHQGRIDYLDSACAVNISFVMTAAEKDYCNPKAPCSFPSTRPSRTHPLLTPAQPAIKFGDVK